MGTCVWKCRLSTEDEVVLAQIPPVQDHGTLTDGVVPGPRSSPLPKGLLHPVTDPGRSVSPEAPCLKAGPV